MIIGIQYKNKFLKIWNSWGMVEFKNINYGSIIANELSSICHYENKKPFINIFNLFINLIKSILYTRIETPYEYENKEGNILYFYEEDDRIDYQLQCEYVGRQLKDLKVVNCKVNKIKNLKKRFDLIATFNKIVLLAKLFFYTFFSKKYFEINGIEKNLILYNKCLNYFDYIRHIDTYFKRKKIDLVITFCDVKEFAGILTQVAKLNKIKTCTQQHAIYIAFNDNNYSQPVINYLNFQSDFILAWGKSLEFNWSDIKFDLSKIILTGCNIPNLTREIKAVDVPRLPEIKLFTVILSAEYWKISNKKMIEFAEKLKKDFQFEYQILFHPTNNISMYKSEFSFLESSNLFQNIKDKELFIKDNQFLIAHTTSMYLTVLMNFRKCFRFVDQDFIDIGGIEDDMFCDYSSLKKMANEDLEFNLEYINKVNEVLKFHYGLSTDSYNKSVLKILKNDS